MKFVFNEKNAIENMLKSGFVDTNNITRTIYYITKYNFHVRHMKDNDNYKFTLDYIVSHCPNIYEPTIYKDIDGCIRDVKNKTFSDVEEIPITKSELSFIKDLNDIREEKVAFVLLAAAKFQNAFKGTNYDSAFINHYDICKMARVVIPKADRDVFMQFAYDKGVLLRHVFADSDVKKVAFVSHDENDEIVLRLKESDYKDLAYTYLAYLKPIQYRRCRICSRWIRRDNKGTDICSDCKQKKKDDKITEKIITCEDCGEMFVVNHLATKTCRCEECQDKASIFLNRLSSKERMKRYRSKE